MKDSATYDLPDSELLKEGNPLGYKVWTPQQMAIILGASNQMESSVFTQNAEKDNIRILKRPSGGESVVLSPNTVCISVAVKRDSELSPKKYFKRFNGIILSALEAQGIDGLNYRGISDISIGEKKILGSAIYQNRDRVVYHAVLNVSESAETFTMYLKHPKKEPDYRKKRSHKAFVTSLKEAGFDLTPDQLSRFLEREIALYWEMMEKNKKKSIN